MKYLVAVDQSENGERAFNAVSHLASKNDHIVVLAVVEEVVPAVSTAAYVDYSYIVAANQKIEDETKVYLAGLGKELTGKQIPHTLLLGKGTPKEVIVNEASDREADVVVMGRRGMGKLARIVVGSVSQYVVQHAPCSVWVVKL